MTTEFHVFHVLGDHLSGPHRTRATADRKAETFRKNCPCGGDTDCAYDDMFPHGVRVAKSVDGRWDNSPDY